MYLNCIKFVSERKKEREAAAAAVTAAAGQKHTIKKREREREVATSVVRPSVRPSNWSEDRTQTAASLRQQSGMGAPPLPPSVALRLDSAGFRVPTKKRKTTTTTTLKNEKYFPNGLASESTKGKRKEGKEGRKEGAGGNCRATTPFSFHLAPNFKEEEEED